MGQQITLDASASRDPEGGALTFLWTFYPEETTMSGSVVHYTYKDPGIKFIGLTVTDNQGKSTAASAQITVKAPSEITAPPLVTETPPQTNETAQNLTQMTQKANPIITMETTMGLTNGASGQSPGGAGSGSNQGSGSANAPPTGPPYFMYMVVVAGVLVGIVLVGIYFVKRPR